MKCPNCGGQMGLEDAVCPYCGTPNAMAVQHQSDMARYRQEYEQTQESVIQKTSFLQRHGSWLIILSILLVALVIGVILRTLAWDIGYSIRENDIMRSAAEDYQMLDTYLEQGEYGKFTGYYSANAISANYDNPYSALNMVAYSYVDLLDYAYSKNSDDNYRFSEDRISDTCGYIATDLSRIFALEKEFYYSDDEISPEMQVYLDDMRERAAVIAKTYFGLTDEDVQEIPNVSQVKLAKMLEEGITK